MSDRGHVVIVDDDASSANTLQELLEEDGYSVDQATSGSNVVETIATAKANLVLVDTHLAHTNPFELHDQLKQSQYARDIPVIFMTTLDDAEAKVKGLESGDDLIVKPFGAREVLARIERQVTVSKVRELDVPGIEPFVGGSVYYGAAVSEAVHYKGRKIFVIGGANSAGQGATFLSRWAPRRREKGGFGGGPGRRSRQLRAQVPRDRLT